MGVGSLFPSSNERAMERGYSHLVNNYLGTKELINTSNFSRVSREHVGVKIVYVLPFFFGGGGGGNT